MRVEQAIHGEVEGTHSLRDASGQEQLARDIANRMDLPVATPPGAVWSSFVSGFPFRKHYVIARTFPDPTAARGGMVFAHALLAPLDELCHWRNVSTLFDRLLTTSKWTSPIGALELIEEPTIPETSSELCGIANALAARGAAPVVRLGCDEFERVVASLWANLWAEARQHFSFRLSFGPDDLYEMPCPAVVCTPSSLAGRWMNYRVAAASDKAPQSTAARILAGSADASKLLEFGRDLPVKLGDIGVLRHLESIEALSRSDVLGELLTAVRFIDSICLSSTGSATKSDILNRLSSTLMTGTCESILAMRNLSFSAFPSSEIIWLAMEGWVAKHEFRARDDAHHLLMLVAAVRAGGAVELWRSAFQRGFAQAVRSESSDLANAIWRWLLETEIKPSELFALLPRESALDCWLASATPRHIDRTQAEELAELALDRGWVISHGAILAAFLKPTEAVSRQIGVDQAPASVAGMRAALRNASQQDVLDCALDISDPRLLDMAATAVADDPAILLRADYTRVEVQKVWVAAIVKKTSAWTAPPDPVATRNRILDDIVSGARDAQLAEALSGTPLADLTDYPERERLWGRLKGKTQERYLQATSIEWLKRARNGDEIYRPDVRLQNQILGLPELTEMLRDRATDSAAMVRAIELLAGFPEERLRDWVTLSGSASLRLSEAQSEALGRLVHARRWKGVCDTLLSLYKRGRYDLKPALTACSDMLGYADKWKLSFYAPTSDEKWEFFTHLAAKLYPNGPADEELWARAGGRNADLPRYTSGAAAWRSTLQKVRFGHNPSARSLLEEMIKDFGGNDELRFLLADSDIAGQQARESR
ncbi:effector-associated domain EAD1-containing protein [Paraburkholderia sp. BR14263]|uniref:GAP1-N1 domain-containing protein n=1 Tax=unclassified Paraburkholderia TaxID=2615204 RepID=UPI0034CE8DA2